MYAAEVIQMPLSLQPPALWDSLTKHSLLSMSTDDSAKETASFRARSLQCCAMVYGVCWLGYVNLTPVKVL